MKLGLTFFWMEVYRKFQGRRDYFSRTRVSFFGLGATTLVQTRSTTWNKGRSRLWKVLTLTILILLKVLDSNGRLHLITEFTNNASSSGNQVTTSFVFICWPTLIFKLKIVIFEFSGSCRSTLIIFPVITSAPSITPVILYGSKKRKVHKKF